MKALGALGGTFNPVHVGHLRAAEEVAEVLDLERVLLIPSALPPHKVESECDRLAPAEQRLAWIRAACAGNPRLEASDLEVHRAGRSYTVDTLEALVERAGGARPVFLIGADAFADIGSWREPERVFALADFAVMTRPGTGGGLAEWLPAALLGSFSLAGDGDSARHRAGALVRAVEISALDVSSSDIRARARSGRSIRYLVPESVRAEIATAFADRGGC